jgi:arabinose-5-phosphate isomerase
MVDPSVERSAQREDPAAAPDPRLEQAREVVRLEAQTIARLEEHLDASFLAAADRVRACQGLVIVTGMGKAGLVGAKISATLASTGTPSISLHPAEAMHGDLGRIRPADVVLALSNSGETSEVLALLPRLRRIGASIIAMTGAPDSALGRLSDCVLDIGRVDEACPLGLAPTASTSAMLALGDALAMVVLADRGFSREDYALYHPSGSLGRRLTRVQEVMRKEEELPLVSPGMKVKDVLVAMTRTKGRPGAALVVDAEGRLVGIFTDGDLRRLHQDDDGTRLDQPVDEFMGRAPKRVRPDALVEEAERILRQHQIDQIAVVDDDGRPVGLLDVQDLLHTRL